LLSAFLRIARETCCALRESKMSPVLVVQISNTTHIKTEFLELQYPWHPLHKQTIPVHFERRGMNATHRGSVVHPARILSAHLADQIPDVARNDKVVTVCRAAPSDSRKDKNFSTSLPIGMWNAKAICWAIRGQPQLGLRCFSSTVIESRIAQEALLRSAPCRATRCNTTMAVDVGSSRAH
jgi:hypothetical protein